MQHINSGQQPINSSSAASSSGQQLLNSSCAESSISSAINIESHAVRINHDDILARFPKISKTEFVAMVQCQKEERQKQHSSKKPHSALQQLQLQPTAVLVKHQAMFPNFWKVHIQHLAVGSNFYTAHVQHLAVGSNFSTPHIQNQAVGSTFSTAHMQHINSAQKLLNSSSAASSSWQQFLNSSYVTYKQWAATSKQLMCNI